MNSYDFIIKCKNCQTDLIYTVLNENDFQCSRCNHYNLSIYGVWHCNNGCEMDVCPLCTLQIQYLCKICKSQITFVKRQFVNNKNIFQCNECFKEFLMEDGAHFCFSCKKFFCCIQCRSQQNDLYNRKSVFYNKGFEFI